MSLHSSFLCADKFRKRIPLRDALVNVEPMESARRNEMESFESVKMTNMNMDMR